MHTITPEKPMEHLDYWYDFVASRYKEGKAEEELRNYDAEAQVNKAVRSWLDERR